MIVSASYRTDIPAFYGRWFLNRLTAGWCDVANPYGGKAYRVSLRLGEADGFVFWTKNIGPFMDGLAAVSARGFPFVVHYTINGYPQALEHSVTSADKAAGHMRALADTYGPRAAVWRYDPIIDTALTTTAWHVGNFARLAAALAGSTDEVAVSWAHIYRKTRRNLMAAARTHGFAWRNPPDDEKRALVARLTEIAADHGMTLTVCSQPDLTVDGATAARCVDAARLSDVADREVAARLKGNRPGCGCYESRDIGAYDTCPHGCVYCYAVQRRALAQRRYRAHDPDRPLLIAGSEVAAPV